MDLNHRAFCGPHCNESAKRAETTPAAHFERRRFCVAPCSVVAITYYSTGVIGYVLKAADKFHLLPVPVEIALGMSVPVIGVAVFVGLNRLKASVHAGAGGTKH